MPRKDIQTTNYLELKISLEEISYGHVEFCISCSIVLFLSYTFHIDEDISYDINAGVI